MTQREQKTVHQWAEVVVTNTPCKAKEFASMTETQAAVSATM